MDTLNGSSITAKVVSLVVAIVVFAMVLVPVVNGLADGGGSGGGGNNDGPITASNEQYVLTKMAYGSNPVFEITPTEEIYTLYEYNEEGTITPYGCYKQTVLYADPIHVVYRDNITGSHVYTLTSPSNVSETMDDQGLGQSITKISSDGETVTIDYVDWEDNALQYSFEVSAPCYYMDSNGEYGVYLNPSYKNAYANMPDDPNVSYPAYVDSLYIPSGYTPYIIGATNESLQIGYNENGYIWARASDGGIYDFTPYYDVRNNKITDAGWDYIDHYYDRNRVLHEDNVHNSCWFMILPNKVTYTPSNTLDNPEPYSMRYSYAEGTIPEFSIDVATDMQSHVITVIVENETITIGSSDSTNIISYLLFATENAFIGMSDAGILYVSEDATMYMILASTIQCSNGQISLIPDGDSIINLSTMSPVEGTVTLGTVDWCYYADPNGDYGNYANTQIGNGLYYNSSNPLCSMGYIGDGISLYRDIEVNLDTRSVSTVTYTLSTSDNLFKGTTWTGGSLAEDDTVGMYWTILPTSISNDNGGNGSGTGSNTGISGSAGTIIKTIPLFVGIGLILAIVSMFYDPKNLIGGQE